jgi:hypothetical protein
VPTATGTDDPLGIHDPSEHESRFKIESVMGRVLLVDKFYVRRHEFGLIKSSRLQSLIV